MAYLLLALLVVPALQMSRRHLVVLWLSTLLCATTMTGCGATPEPAAAAVVREIPPERIKAVCWKPAEFGPKEHYYVFPWDNEVAVSEANGQDFGIGLRRSPFIYKYDPFAPASSLIYVPLSRPDAWCTQVPKPTDDAVLRLLDPCSEPMSDEEALALAKKVFKGILTKPPSVAPFAISQPRVGLKSHAMQSKSALRADCAALFRLDLAIHDGAETAEREWRIQI